MSAGTWIRVRLPTPNLPLPGQPLTEVGAGFDHVRVQSHGYGELVKSDPPPPPRPKGSSDGPTAQDAAFNPRKYMAELPRLFEYLRSELGEVRFLVMPAAGASTLTCSRPGSPVQNSFALLCTQEIELLHDVHERLSCSQAIQVCQAVEPYRPFFMEDPLPPEQLDHFKQLRAQTSVPLAMGVSLISLRKAVQGIFLFPDADVQCGVGGRSCLLT